MESPRQTAEYLIGALQRVTIVFADKSSIELNLTTKDSWRVDWSQGEDAKKAIVVSGDHELIVRWDIERTEAYNPPVLEKSRIA